LEISNINSENKLDMNPSIPLAERLRPLKLQDYIGQEHLIGEKGILSSMLAAGNLPSMVLWGPPGVGKTTLAKLMAQELKRPLYTLSAVHSGVKDVREAIENAKKQKFFNTPNPILFIDEIHRFSKSQQDSLLAAVEQGVVTLIGATTENPSFEVISPLLSRCQVYILQPMSEENMDQLIRRALETDSEIRNYKIRVAETEAIFRFAGGDARKLYNILELLVYSNLDKDEIVIDNRSVTQKLQENLAFYDKGGEMHYDIISAFIKSIRGSDPNAAVYWLARMLDGGEDIKFIARRLIILAAEDIGLANPNALLLANSCFQSVHVIGMPEARIILSQTAIYLASSPKSNSAYMAIDEALATVKQTGNQPVPLHLRNAPTRLMKNIGYGADYQYSHMGEGNFIRQEYLPEKLSGKEFYKSGANAQEEKSKEFLKKRWKDHYQF
jgi:putative ATPase